VELPLEHGLRVGMGNGSFANAIGRTQESAAFIECKTAIMDFSMAATR